MKITDRMIWAAAKAAYFEMNSVMHDHEKLWSAERKLKGNVWYDVAKRALEAAAKYEPVS
jgi:hypothetical protein